MRDVLKMKSELSKLGYSIELYSAKGLCQLMKDKLSNKVGGNKLLRFRLRLC